MAAIAKAGTPAPSSDVPQSNKLTLLAGAVIADGDAVYINADGRFYPCDGSAAAAAAAFFGIAPVGGVVGDAVTAMFGVRVPFATGQTPGTLAYLSTSVVGGFDTVNATVTRPVGRFVDESRLQVFYPFHKYLA